jgi:hypothetical protein
MKDRTYWDRLRRLKKQRGEPLAVVRSGAEPEAANAILRRGLELLLREIRRFELKAASEAGLTGEDLTNLNRCMKSAADWRRQQTKQRAMEDLAAGDGRDKGRAVGGDKRSVVEELGKRWERGPASEPLIPGREGESSAIEGESASESASAAVA